MIKFFKTWCEGIIVAIILSIIIEMLVPDGNNKKYVKVVIGIFIVFVVLNPILSKLGNNTNFENIFEIQDTKEVSVSIDESIKDVFIKGIEESIKNEISEMGYLVKEVKVSVDSKYENIEEIELEISGKELESIIQIEPIEISKEDKQINNNEFMNIKQYIAENYKVNTEKIYITER